MAHFRIKKYTNQTLLTPYYRSEFSRTVSQHENMDRKNCKMKVRIIHFLMTVLVLSLASVAAADHALLSSGKIVYNVIVPDGATTGGKLLRLRTTQASFGFDPRTNTIYALPKFSLTDRVEDFVSTSKSVGREQAVTISTQQNWGIYRPKPAAPPLIMPSPAPKQTPVPAAAQVQATPVPLNVVDDSIPLEKRLDQQLKIFMAEQTKLVRDGATSVVQGLVTPTEVNAEKVNLLRRQQSILERFYPQSAESVRLSVEYWQEQVKRTGQTGKFDLENL